jgi:hypothetical protein
MRCSKRCCRVDVQGVFDIQDVGRVIGGRDRERESGACERNALASEGGAMGPEEVEEKTEGAGEAARDKLLASNENVLGMCDPEPPAIGKGSGEFKDTSGGQVSSVSTLN